MFYKPDKYPVYYERSQHENWVHLKGGRFWPTGWPPCCNKSPEQKKIKVQCSGLQTTFCHYYLPSHIPFSWSCFFLWCDLIGYIFSVKVRTLIFHKISCRTTMQSQNAQSLKLECLKSCQSWKDPEDNRDKLLACDFFLSEAIVESH